VPPEKVYSRLSDRQAIVTWILRLYDVEGREVGTANHFTQSFSVEMGSPNGEALRDALADRDEFGGFIRPTADKDLGEIVVPIEHPQVALDRVGSEITTTALVDSYEVINDG